MARCTGLRMRQSTFLEERISFLMSCLTRESTVCSSLAVRSFDCIEHPLVTLASVPSELRPSFMPEYPRTPYAGSSVYEKASFTSSNCRCWGGSGTIYYMLGKSK
jgi:hypothetical protein